MTDSLKDRIAAFNEVRDMPYFIATRGEQDCCCSTKAYFLEKKLRILGLECRHALCWFKWEKLGLSAAVLSISHEALPCHQFLEVLIPESNEWVIVDPTWDKELKGALPINNWDGLTGTDCAVPIERLCTQDETARIFKECEDPRLVSEYFESQGPFLRAVNEYLVNVRKTYRDQIGPTVKRS